MAAIQQRACELLGDAYLEQDNFREAYRCYSLSRNSAAPGDLSPEAFMLLARRALARGLFTTARSASALAGSALSANDSELLRQCATKALERGLPDEAFLAFSEANVLPPNEELVGCGRQLLNVGKCIDAYDCFVMGDADSAHFSACGRKALGQGLLDLALQAFTDAKDKEGLLAWAKLALKHLSVDEVLVTFAVEGIELPRDALLKCGHEALRRGELATGLHAFQAIGVEPPQVGLVICGSKALELGWLDTAINAYRRAGVFPAAEQVASCGRKLLAQNRQDAARRAFLWAAQLEEAKHQ